MRLRQHIGLWGHAGGTNLREAKISDGLAAKPPRTERERLLSQAGASRGLMPVAQRDAVKGLIRDSLWSRTCSPGEILGAAYGDPQGRRYWELWLSEPLRVYQFADLLAVHYAATEGAPVASVLGKSAPVLDGYLRQIFERLRAAVEAGETWFIGDTSSLLTETWPSLALRNSALSIRPSQAIVWMHRNPTAQHLIPPTTAKIVGAISNEIAAAAQQKGDFACVSIAGTETAAAKALASHLRDNPRLKLAEAAAFCREAGFELSDRGFHFRVWPRARACRDIRPARRASGDADRAQWGRGWDRRRRGTDRRRSRTL